MKNAIKYREENKCERKDFIQLLIELRKSDLLAGTSKAEATNPSCKHNQLFSMRHTRSVQKKSRLFKLAGQVDSSQIFGVTMFTQIS